MSLVIHLQEGFEGDSVVIRLDGQEVFRKAYANLAALA